MKNLLRFSLAAAFVATTGCDDERAKQLPTAPLEVAPGTLSAYVTVSNSRPKVGDQLTVTVRARRGSDVGPIGSFTVELMYDSTALAFREVGRIDQGMVMGNISPRGRMIAAGASAEGFLDDELVIATFEVTGANAIASLALQVKELNSLQFTDEMARLKVLKSIYRDAPRAR
jgi:hypothetical protein